MCEFLIRLICFMAGAAAGAAGLLLLACIKIGGDTNMEVTDDNG